MACYREDLSWLRNVPAAWQITIYDKSGEAKAPPLPRAALVSLPNVGREAHTYLHHIVTRYDDLAPRTVFCQGKPFDHAFDFHATLRRMAAQKEITTAFEPLGHLVDTDSHDGARLFKTWSKNEDGHGLDMRGFHRALWDSDGPDLYTFRGGAQFAVTRECIREQPRAFYERALAVSASYPEAAHCFERSWPLVLGLVNPDLAWLDGRELAYLKPPRKSLATQD